MSANLRRQCCLLDAPTNRLIMGATLSILGILGALYIYCTDHDTSDIPGCTDENSTIITSHLRPSFPNTPQAVMTLEDPPNPLQLTFSCHKLGPLLMCFTMQKT
jgi:hypothetical protein